MRRQARSRLIELKMPAGRLSRPPIGIGPKRGDSDAGRSHTGCPASPERSAERYRWLYLRWFQAQFEAKALEICGIDCENVTPPKGATF